LSGAECPEPGESRRPSRDQAAFTQGFRLDAPSMEDLTDAIEAALDYRGDVTFVVDAGESVIGYVFNRRTDGADSYLEIFPQDGGQRRRILYRSIRSLHFSGRDAASGKSWETWAKLYQEKKAARERGEDVGAIGLSPEPLA
jgi:hypothetical protein